MPAKRKIQVPSRTAFWPCGSCRTNCKSDCLFCASCKQWFHVSCEQISEFDFDYFQKSKTKFTCQQCFLLEVGEHYSYCHGLLRLLQATELHEQEYLRFTARREGKAMGDFSFFGAPVISQEFVEIDHNALDTMRRTNLSTCGVPSMTTGDGNCLFNAASIALTGDERLSTELRLRTAVDMILNGNIYKSRKDFLQLALVSPDYDVSVRSCCLDGGYSSVWTMLSLSIVTGKPLQSLYPAMNGPNDETCKILTKMFPNSTDVIDPLTILWCKTGPSRTSTWTPNHFVPVFKTAGRSTDPVFTELDGLFLPSHTSTPNKKRKVDTKITGECSSKKVSKTDSTMYSTSSSSERQTEDMVSDEEGNKYKIKKLVRESESDSSFQHNTTVDSQQNQDHEDAFSAETSSESPPNNNIGAVHESTEVSLTSSNPTANTVLPLPAKRFLSVDEIYTILTSKHHVCAQVPSGDKSDSYAVVDNQRNIENLRAKRRCDFYDDCGIWESGKGNTVKTTYFLKNSSLSHTELKDGNYCTKRRDHGRVIWEPLSPQPASDDIVTFSRYYATHKGDPGFRKKVTFMIKTNNPEASGIAIYEYQGKQPFDRPPHGNGNANKSFYRTNPKTLDKIVEQMPVKNPKKIFQELKKDNSTDCVRDFDVIRSKKFNENKKAKIKKKQTTNIADEILEVIGLLNVHPFTQTMIHHKDMVPSIICYTRDQIEDLKQFLAGDHGYPLGIDRTFNLSAFYVTTIVYKNPRLVRKNSNENPIFLGPLMLHKDASYKTYKEFLEHVATEVDSEVTSLELRVSSKMVFGSDDEKALTNAIDHVFPSSQRLLCTKHLKDNVKNYCQNKAGMPRNERKVVSNQIFNDLLTSETSFDFEERALGIKRYTEDKYPAFAKYFENQLKQKLRNHVFAPDTHQDKKRLWTNNNAESMNNIIKISTGWKPKCTGDLIDELYEITNLHFMDYRSALHDGGNYRLVPSENNYKIKEAEWRAKSEDEKRTLFQDFLKNKKRPSLKKRLITSKDGRFSVITKAKGTAKKPGQRKRPLSERAQKR